MSDVENLTGQDAIDFRGVVKSYAPANLLQVIGLGDSITAQNYDAPGLSGSIKASQSAGHIAVANALLGHPFEIIGNAGVSSETTAQIAARVASVIAAKPDLVIVLAGQNDTTAGIAPATAIATLRDQIYAPLRAAGIDLCICTMTSTTQLASGGDQPARRAYHSAINAFIRQYARAEGVLIADLDYATTDPSTGQPITSLLRDGVHPAPFGAWQAMGPCLAEALAPYARPRATASAGRYDARNYVVNSGMVGDNASAAKGFVLAAGTTGTGPDAAQTWKRNTGSGVASKAARAAGGWRPDTGLAQIALTMPAQGDGGGFSFGGDVNAGTGRYDVTWGVGQTVTKGSRRKPTTPNGFIYTVINDGGTLGITEPTWPTVEGATVTDGATTLFMAQKAPASGDTFIASCDVFVSGLTAAKGAQIFANLAATDTSPAIQAEVSEFAYDVSGSGGPAPQAYPLGLIRIVTPPLVLPSMTLRYLSFRVGAYGEAGSTLTLQVGAPVILRVD